MLTNDRKATGLVPPMLIVANATPAMEVHELSGGNTEPRILLLDEPTRGVDVGAKHEIYQLMNEWTSQGMAIILITSEMPELLAMSDRILVLHRGRATAELVGETATPDRVLEAARGTERFH